MSTLTPNIKMEILELFDWEKSLSAIFSEHKTEFERGLSNFLARLEPLSNRNKIHFLVTEINKIERYFSVEPIDQADRLLDSLIESRSRLEGFAELLDDKKLPVEIRNQIESGKTLSTLKRFEELIESKIPVAYDCITGFPGIKPAEIAANCHSFIMNDIVIAVLNAYMCGWLEDQVDLVENERTPKKKSYEKKSEIQISAWISGEKIRIALFHSLVNVEFIDEKSDPKLFLKKGKIQWLHTNSTLFYLIHCLKSEKEPLLSKKYSLYEVLQFHFTDKNGLPFNLDAAYQWTKKNRKPRESTQIDSIVKKLKLVR
jgi:hypothetical protein